MDSGSEAAGVAEVMPGKLTELREKLSRKAKQQPNFRFYALYDRIYRTDVLFTAWQLVRRKHGAPGVDRISFEQIERSPAGVNGFLQDLQEQLRTKSYRAQSVRRVYIRKPDGRLRPLGIPTIVDRVAQMAARLILEPIFEADFLDCSYGFRAGRSAHQALEEVQKSIREGYQLVYDADLEAYFDTIPHDKLMLALKRRISDGTVLRLIQQWLRASVVEPNGTITKTTGKGTPQGGVLSPLLANLYLHWFDVAFHKWDSPAQRWEARLIRYADDFLVLMRRGGLSVRQWVEDLLTRRFGLSINQRKTKLVYLKKGGSIDFLGYTFRYDKDLYGRPHKYLNMVPSKKSVKKARSRMRELTDSRRCWVPISVIVRDLRTFGQGWQNYFRLGYPSEAYRLLDSYIQIRLFIHLNRRSQRRSRLRHIETVYAFAKRNGLLLAPDDSPVHASRR